MNVSYRLKSSQFTAPLQKGEELGIIDVKLDGRLLASAPLIALEDVNEGGFFSRMIDRMVMFFTGSTDDQTEQE